MKLRNPNDAIFQLIKTMDSGEKRFFNLFCNRQYNKAGKIYLNLFKAIDKQSNYNESILKVKFKNYGTRFNLIKAYLYKLVIESSAQYYTQNYLSLYDQLLKIKVLYEKGLLELSQKMVYNVRNLAEEQNNYVIAFETINIERLLLLKSGSLTEKNISALEKQRKHYLSLNNELELYKQLYDKIAFFDSKYGIMYRDDIEKEKEFKKIARSTLFKNINKPRSTMSKWLLLRTRGMYYKILDNNNKADKEYLAVIKLLDRNPDFKKSYPDYVAHALKRYITSCIEFSKFNLALQKLSELKAFCSLHSTFEIRKSLLNCQIMEQFIYLNTDRKSEAMQLISEIDEKIEKEEISEHSNKLIFYTNAAITCVDFSEYQKSLYFVNKVLNSELAEKNKPNVYCGARVIQLINLVELQEYDLLSYRLKSFHRFIGKHKSIYRYQEIFMSFIRRILKGEFNKNNLLMLYKEVKEALANAFRDPEEARAGSYFDFVGWFESKIENIPYPTWIKKNLKINKK